LLQVESYWVKGYLAASLHHQVLLQLDKEMQPSMVICALDKIVSLDQANYAIPTQKKMLMIFEEDATKLLLILGEPGSGKTTTLLELAKELIDKTRQKKEYYTIPVVLNLSSWSKEQLPLDQWIISEIGALYRIPKEKVAHWLAENRILPLLDGLDEVKESVRSKCTHEINQFSQRSGLTGIVVCCRVEEYQHLTEKLCLNAAIHLQPLRDEQIDQYLKKAGSTLSALKALLKTDQELRSLATKPLMLNIMSLAYDRAQPQTLQPTIAHEQRKSQLFDLYISKMLSRRKTEKKIYPDEDVKYYLKWLAAQLQKHDQTVFLVENLQPDWVISRQQITRGVSTIYKSLTVWLWVIFWVLFFSLQEASGIYILIGTWLGGAWFLGRSRNIKTTEALGWSRTKLRRWILLFFVTLIIALPLFGLLFIFLFFMANQSLLGGIRVGLLCGFIWAFFNSLLQVGLENPIPEIKDRVNQGIISSLQNALRFGIPLGFILGSFVWLAISTSDHLSVSFFNTSFSGTLIGFLLLGGDVVIQHYILRWALFLEGYIPLNIVGLLNYACRLILLQKVGGGYLFVHRLLLEHFAKDFVQKPSDKT